ncbi:MAG: homoserine kinase [Chloroflexi bacterium]|nr:homoserine kinase [Chloroflexota bacterium]
MPPTSLTVRVPATSANLGAGFDCLGLALDLWGSVTVTDGPQPPQGDRPLEGMALAAARRLWDEIGQRAPQGLSARYEGAIPVARGLGASAVARVGGLMAASALAGDPLDREALLTLAAELEGHADNAAPALFGGLQVTVREDQQVVHAGVPLPPGLRAVLFVPELRMPTQESRRLLPRSLSREDAVHNIGRAALLVAALGQGRFDLLDAATQDRLHQHARSQLFPAMYAIFDAAKQAGAHCAYLSGGGSTICALASGGEQAIARAMAEAASSREVPGETIIAALSERGAEIVEEA